MGISYNFSNPKSNAINLGDPCYLKSEIQSVTQNQRRVYVARRIQYNVGDAPIFTSIRPSGVETSQPGQASTFPAPVSIFSTITTTLSSSPSSNRLDSSLIVNLSATLITTTTEINTPQSSTSFESRPSQTDTKSAAAASSSSPSPSATASAIQSSTSSSGGLSDGTKIGIGVALGVAAAIILSLLLYIFCSRRKRRRRDNSNREGQLGSTITPAELGQSYKPGQKPVVIIPTSMTQTQRNHPVTERQNVTNMQELSARAPAAAELGYPKYYELPTSQNSNQGTHTISSPAMTSTSATTGMNRESDLIQFTDPSNASTNTTAVGSPENRGSRGSWKWSILGSSGASILGFKTGNQDQHSISSQNYNNQGPGVVVSPLNERKELQGTMVGSELPDTNQTRQTRR